MKTLKYVLSIAATLTAIACVQEENPVTDNSNVELVPMTFTVTADTEADTKVFYDGEATKWEKDDKIMVISANGIATEFTATEVNGATATFEGETEQSDKFYAVYPVNAYRGNDLASPTNTDKGGRLYVNVPEIQTAVAGTFDKNAFVSIAESEGDNLNFKNLCSVVKFNLDNPEGVKSVRFTMTSNTNLAGTGNVYVKNITVHSWGDAIKTTESDKDQRYSSNMITLKAPDGGFLADTDYYFVQRAYKQSEDKISSESPESKPDGVQFYIEYEDNVKVRNGASAFDAIRNTVVPVGTIDDQEATLEDVTPYDSYNLGFDLVVGDKTYNVSETSARQIIANTETNLSNEIKTGGLIFISNEGEGTFVISENAAVTKDVILVGNNTEITIKSGKAINYQKATLAFKNISLNVAEITTNQSISNYGAASDSESLIFDNCIISGVSRPIYAINAGNSGAYKPYTCKNIILKDTDIKLINASTSSVNIIDLSNTTSGNTESISFTNCVIYNTSNCPGIIARYTALQDQYKTNIKFNNNTVFNIHAGTNNGLLHMSGANSVEFKNNLVNFYGLNSTEYVIRIWQNTPVYTVENNHFWARAAAGIPSDLTFYSNVMVEAAASNITSSAYPFTTNVPGAGATR